MICQCSLRMFTGTKTKWTYLKAHSRFESRLLKSCAPSHSEYVPLTPDSHCAVAKGWITAARWCEGKIFGQHINAKAWPRTSDVTMFSPCKDTQSPLFKWYSPPPQPTAGMSPIGKDFWSESLLPPGRMWAFLLITVIIDDQCLSDFDRCWIIMSLTSSSCKFWYNPCCTSWRLPPIEYSSILIRTALPAEAWTARSMHALILQISQTCLELKMFFMSSFFFTPMHAGIRWVLLPQTPQDMRDTDDDWFMHALLQHLSLSPLSGTINEHFLHCHAFFCCLPLLAHLQNFCSGFSSDNPCTRNWLQHSTVTFLASLSSPEKVLSSVLIIFSISFTVDEKSDWPTAPHNALHFWWIPIERMQKLMITFSAFPRTLHLLHTSPSLETLFDWMWTLLSISLHQFAAHLNILFLMTFSGFFESSSMLTQGSELASCSLSSTSALWSFILCLTSE